MSGRLHLGVDIGTSGVRAIVIDDARDVQGEAAMRFGADPKSPSTWLSALENVLRTLSAEVDLSQTVSVAVDGTSGTMLAVGADGAPVAGPLMYDEAVGDAETLTALEARQCGHLAGMATGRAFHLARRAPDALIVHQADWLSGQFSGRFGISDDNNALKTGFDPQSRRWSGEVEALGLFAMLPQTVLEPGTPIGPAIGPLSKTFGLSADATVIAGTTDGCAAFLASGAGREGDGVTSLGSTLTLKLLSARRIEDRASGIYSHRLLGLWLAGGASNSGGRVLAQHFSTDEMEALSQGQSAAPPTDLDYYPLVAPGERFPVNDPQLQPCLEPRPDDDALFLKAMLEGLAQIEARGYRRLAELGAPPVSRIFTVGGGAANPLWTDIRAMALGVDLEQPISAEAAFGAALLARMGVS
ncbi:FGGY-family carbohydrate kinase [Notoacmeibacter marinus]|uniref:FGGY-family carbohydrate kinase n=1 Tax=Notoacmeibacter marinus TaxID=1876515 RepID=UPI000DF22A75|nr:FGGY-family carbohydrate kinase [Notoacmeibacter marinus]